jgi:hypothetical protein
MSPSTDAAPPGAQTQPDAALRALPHDDDFDSMDMSAVVRGEHPEHPAGFREPPFWPSKDIRDNLPIKDPVIEDVELNLMSKEEWELAVTHCLSQPRTANFERMDWAYMAALMRFEQQNHATFWLFTAGTSKQASAGAGPCYKETRVVSTSIYEYLMLTQINSGPRH